MVSWKASPRARAGPIARGESGSSTGNIISPITAADFQCTWQANLNTPGSIGTVGYDKIERKWFPFNRTAINGWVDLGAYILPEMVEA